MTRTTLLTASLIVALGATLGLNQRASAAPASGHDMDMDMDMGSVDGLQTNFAHKDLVVLDKIAVPAAFAEALGAAYQGYLEASDALVAADIARLDAAATKMREAIEGVQAEQLDGAASAAWTGHKEVLSTSLHQLTSASGVDAKREHFSHISEAMYCALRSFGGVEQTVNVDFCPMAFDGKGAFWLSDSAVIANPYLGPDMATCGELKETIR